jgi:hypothetical protein
MAAKQLKCRECGTEYPLEARYVCSKCFGPLEVGYDHEHISDVGEVRRRIQGGPQNIWRYHDFLPLEGPQPRTRTGLPAGCTPLIRADRLAERLGLAEVWVKNDAAHPTHSGPTKMAMALPIRRTCPVAAALRPVPHLTGIGTVPANSGLVAGASWGLSLHPPPG